MQNVSEGCAGAAGEEVTMNAAAGRAPYLAPSVRRLDVAAGTEGKTTPMVTEGTYWLFDNWVHVGSS